MVAVHSCIVLCVHKLVELMYHFKYKYIEDIFELMTELNSKY